VASRDRRRSAMLVAVAGIIGLIPVPGRAEGAVRFLDCTVMRTCDAAGVCQLDVGQTVFRIEPVDVAADGSGRYVLSYGNSQAEMQAGSAAGPFFWTAGTQRHTLIANSETLFMWHQLTLDPVPDAAIRFMTCALRQ